MASLTDLTANLDGEAKRIHDQLVKKRAQQGTNLRGLYIPLMNHPELAEHIEGLGYYLKFEGKLPRNAYQFTVLYVARKTGVAFIWLDHQQSARDAGLGDSLIQSVMNMNLEKIEPPYFLIMKTLDVVFDFGSIPQGLQDEMIKLYGIQGLMEVVTLCGFYQMVGEITRAFDVPLPESTKKPF